MPTRIPASELTGQKLDELLTQGVAGGDARAELLKLAVRKIVEEVLEAEVAEAVGRELLRDRSCPRHRVSRRHRDQRVEPQGGKPGDRAPVAGIRGLRQPGPQRVAGRLPLRRRRRRAPARQAAA